MPTHLHFSAFTPEQIFDFLYYLHDNTSRNGGSVDAGLLTAAPSAELTRLLLHAAVEDPGEVGKSVHLLLNDNLGNLGQGLPPDPTTWRAAASWLLHHLHDRLKINWDGARWNIECNPELLKVPEIRQLINKATDDQQFRIKNWVSGSTIEAGGNVHIGDVHYHQPPAETPAKPGQRTPVLLRIAVASVVVIIIVLLLMDKCTGCWSPATRIVETPETSGTTAPATILSADTLVEAPAHRIRKPEVAAPKPARPPKPSGGLMAGLITNSAGEALDSVLVSVVGLGVDVWTDAHGQFRLHIKETPSTGEVQLRFSKLGYRAQVITYFEVPKMDIRKILSPLPAPSQ